MASLAQAAVSVHADVMCVVDFFCVSTGILSEGPC